MMIDSAFQGKGYGKAALQEVLKYIASKPFGSSGTVLLTCNPQNEVAGCIVKSDLPKPAEAMTTKWSWA